MRLPLHNDYARVNSLDINILKRIITLRLVSHRQKIDIRCSMVINFAYASHYLTLVRMCSQNKEFYFLTQVLTNYFEDAQRKPRLTCQ
jgi:dolichyl-phosphate-mannose--protein O-mannosyl transferase